MNKRKIAILGDGAWGTTLAILLAEKGHNVSLWGAFSNYIQIVKKMRENEKFLPQFKIPDTVNITDNAHDAANQADIVIIAIPSKFLRKTLTNFKDLNLSDCTITSVIKGIENKTLKRPSEIIKEELNLDDVCVVSGPNIAIEVARKAPASCVCACKDTNKVNEVQDALITDRFRAYTSDDVIGVELGGSLKNIIAIAAGISDGLGFGCNAKSALFTRGLVEMSRLGVAMGAKQETFNGLSGMGDLMTTCISPFSRNRYVGEEIARGKTLIEIVQHMNSVAEGICTTESVCELSKKYNIEMPITDQIYKVLFENKNPLEAVTDLMKRQRKSEQ